MPLWNSHSATLFGIVVSRGQPVAVRLHVEGDAGCAIGIPAIVLNFADGAVREVIDTLSTATG